MSSFFAAAKEATVRDCCPSERPASIEYSKSAECANRSCFYFGEVEDVVDQSEKVLPVFFARGAEPGPNFVGYFAVNIILDEFGVAEDRVQRRSQLVADVGEKLRFVTVGNLELLALRFDLLKQAGIVDGQRELLGNGIDQVDVSLRISAGSETIEEEDTDRGSSGEQTEPLYCFELLPERQKRNRTNCFSVPVDRVQRAAVYF